MIPGERIRLRRIEREDLPRLAAWVNEPEVRRHLAHIYPMSVALEERWFEAQLTLEPAAQPFVIDVRAESVSPDSADPAWAPAGVGGLHAIDWLARSAEIGLFIGPAELRGAGYGTEVVRTLLSWCFRALNLHRVHLRVYEDNVAGIRCYEKVGFRVEGRLRQSRFQDGRYIDTLVMAVLRDEWTG